MPEPTAVREPEVDDDRLDPARFLPVDITADEVRDNFPEVLSGWAQRPPFYARLADVPHVVCARYDDVLEVLLDRDRFSVEVGGHRRFDRFNGVQTLAQLDGAPHDRLRRLMNPAFVARSAREFDAMADFASHLMVHVLLDAMFRLNEEQQQVFVDMQRSLGRSYIETGATFSPEFLAAFDRVRVTIDEIVDERRANPGDDFISHLVRANVDEDALNDRELFDQIFSVCGAALQTTATSMGAVLLLLCRHPDQLDDLRSDPSLVPAAVEGCLRLHGPGFVTFPRFATVDTTVGGTPVLENMPVLVSQQAANLDPTQYSDPLRFDIHREPKNILTFGAGVHLCLGFRLARMVLHAGLSRTLARFPGLRLTDPDFRPAYRGPLGHLAFPHLPLSKS
jgi:cytochrome P450